MKCRNVNQNQKINNPISIMEPTTNKMETFFLAMAQLITSGTIKRGKDFKLKEEANGKVLYLHIESIYSHYNALLGINSLSIIYLRTYLESSPAFVKYKSTRFKWNDPINELVSRKYTRTICAVMLCYDTLKEKYNINFEKHSIAEFEAAIIAKGVPVENIDEIKQKGKFVSMALGYVNNQKCTWDAEGKCFMKNGTPYQLYNLNFD